MNGRPPMGDYAAWQTYWREEGKRNRAKCDRMTELVRLLKSCDMREFDSLAYELRQLDASAKNAVESIRASREAGKYTEKKEGNRRSAY